ncbi:MAG: AAA family ATPase [Prolixibacteraceae bacterium]|jgi:hypothetical protein|nr:AAA family ATPase [Prolixibacteraceae bacterium]MBT6765960.1 AAA family ATPase [Prolixibacteraceae bacterium]MBT7000902.1 AAA family ATPase [Prolixibacteraceae bacterium]MBT7394136.1 AAA family ATPase [Prolixibacteraceae bacterium]
MMRNNLFISRLYIQTNEGKVAYDETFHKGVNIIRGDNSSGKSTITHFIFFVLGGAFSEFVPEARKCSIVYAEVEMNKAIITIKRYIEEDEDGNINIKASMFFFWGELSESLNPPKDKTWQRFGYNTTENRKSYSNVLFENIGLPIVKADNNITFHQILRLLYIDQESPTSSLYYYENFDSQLTRETVADLLLGIYNEELYERKRRLIGAEKELLNIKSELKATKHFFTDQFALNPQHIKEAISNKEKEIHEIESEIIEIRNKNKEIEYEEKSKLNFQILQEQSIKQRKIVASLKENISILNNEISDTSFFIDTLKDNIVAIKNSIQTREFLGHLPLDYCPDCLTKIKESSDKTRCKLCKEVIDESFGVVQAKRMEQEVSFQLQESQKIISTNKRTLIELKSKNESELVKLHQFQRQVNSALKDVKSVNDEKLDNLLSSKGYVEGEIVQYKTMLENAELYASLLKKKNDLINEIDSLKAFIFNTERKQTVLKDEITTLIKQEGLYILNNDLDRQDEFKNANEFTIDFSNNLTFLSNKYSKYSASSNFYLKVAARFALFLASLSVEGMRIPRFIFADNMEDKGIELLRAQNLQKILIDRVSDFNKNSYQMIYTTSYITKELNESEYVVGEYYTKSNPSLKNIVK